jgi:hypothetical protein
MNRIVIGVDIAKRVFQLHWWVEPETPNFGSASQMRLWLMSSSTFFGQTFQHFVTQFHS